MKIRVHSVEPASRANGPGLRAVLWLQGCSLACPGCFNPSTHDPTGGYEADTDLLAEEIGATPGIDGVSISGGEPFQQPAALAELLAGLRRTPLSILLFSGYTIDAIRRMPLGPGILAAIDELIDGPYVQAQPCGHGLLGSTNQQIHLLTGRHKPDDFPNLPRREVILHRDGSMTLTGIAPLHIP